MTPNLQEAAVNQALLASGRTAVAVLDASKWGILGLRSFCPTRDIGVLVTDSRPDARTTAVLDESGTTLIVADPLPAPDNHTTRRTS